MDRSPPSTAAAVATNITVMKPAGSSEPMMGAPTTPASAASMVPITQA